ncbi:hypothetical protein D4764_01G0016280 [Takifugu flavidus]|uniref:Uncharacterized protein n=1 Tax=Takifugu flavidus TaxID=433684 RepID=A0A5C6PQP4_9TELE|nr:hypothetical protein D4764_01G0016280 [Takifugu flavidus]
MEQEIDRQIGAASAVMQTLHRDRVRSSAIREELGVELLLFRIERSQMRWLGHLVRMPPGRLPGEVYRACPSGRRPPGRPRTYWRDDVSRLVWERLGIPPDELEEVAGEREVWASLLRLLPRRPDPEDTTGLREYIKKMAPTDQLLSECLRQQKPTKEEEPEGLSWKDKECTTDKRKWLISRKHSSGWQRLD